MNNNQIRYNASFDGDEGNNFILEYNVLPGSEDPLVYESGDDDNLKFVFISQVIKR